MKLDLSIIIPCYNCQDTLEEAVNSCFVQDLDNFEVVMVDDGSTDNTKKLMSELAEKHKEIKLFYHEKNQGGGATRNTAVRNSKSDIIFCLDGDDILPKNTLSKMFLFMKEKNCDGVLFEETRFFYDKNIKKTEIVKNTILNSEVKLIDLFIGSKGFLTKVNFLYTKDSFNNCGGYPTDHGFDTQTFGLKFLLNESKVYVCPDTFYFHRRNKKPTSYFMRENTDGKLSFNTYLMNEEVLYLFPDDLIKTIFNYDVIENNVLGGDNLGVAISGFFIKHKEVSFSMENSKKGEFSKKIIEAVYNYKKGDYEKSFDLYVDLIKEFPDIKLLYINMVRCLLCKSGFISKISNEQTFKIFQPQKTKSKFLLLAERLDRVFKKICKN